MWSFIFTMLGLYLAYKLLGLYVAYRRNKPQIDATLSMIKQMKEAAKQAQAQGGGYSTTAYSTSEATGRSTTGKASNQASPFENIIRSQSAPAIQDTILECHKCHLLVPEQEGIKKNGHFYCSAEHSQ